MAHTGQYSSFLYGSAAIVYNYRIAGYFEGSNFRSFRGRLGNNEN